jgi:hypothetical protein
VVSCAPKTVGLTNVRRDYWQFAEIIRTEVTWIRCPPAIDPDAPLLELPPLAEAPAPPEVVPAAPEVEPAPPAVEPLPVAPAPDVLLPEEPLPDPEASVPVTSMRCPACAARFCDPASRM